MIRTYVNLEEVELRTEITQTSRGSVIIQMIAGVDESEVALTLPMATARKLQAKLNGLFSPSKG